VAQGLGTRESEDCPILRGSSLISLEPCGTMDNTYICDATVFSSYSTNERNS
jgi:hypothetical protein